MSWLLDSPFVLFETPLWIQLAFALPFWTVYFAVKYTIRFFERRKVRRWWDFDAFHRQQVAAYVAGREPLGVDAWIDARKAGRA